MSDEPLTDARNLNAKAYDLYIRGELDKLVFKVVRERDIARSELELIKKKIMALKRFSLDMYEDEYGCLVWWDDIEEIIGK